MEYKEAIILIITFLIATIILIMLYISTRLFTATQKTKTFKHGHPQHHIVSSSRRNGHFVSGSIPPAVK